MNWKKFTETISPYVDIAKDYGQKVVKFTEDQIQTTPLFLKNQAEYDAILTEKRVVIVGYDETQSIVTEIQLLSSIWLTRAFMDNTKLRFISLGDSSDLARNIGMVGPIDMRVRLEGQETYQFTDIIDIKKWWQSPIYKKLDGNESIGDHVKLDPLNGL